MNQKDAVFSAVVEVLGGEPTSAVELTNEEKTQVTDILVSKFQSGEVEFAEGSRDKYTTEQAIKAYSRGVLSNYLRRDTRLNGGTKHVPAVTKGPRVPKDEQLEAMKNLKKKLEIEGNAEGITEVEESIMLRTQQLTSAKTEAKTKPKAKAVSVDLSVIPPELRSSLNL